MLREETSPETAMAGRFRASWTKMLKIWQALGTPQITEALPGHLITCLTAFALGLLYLAVAFSIVPDDVSRLRLLFGPEWVPAHVIFRSACCVVGFVLMVRGILRRTTTADFMAFLALGMAHTWEGTLFNTSYYLSFIQFVILLGWFSTINWRPFTAVVVTSGAFYSWLLTYVGTWQGMDGDAVNDLIIAVLVATFSGPLAAFFRSHWQDLNQRLLKKHLEDNARLIDLGRHLGIICHDIGNSLCILRFGVMQLEEGPVKDQSFNQTIAQLAKATDHIDTIQRFVLGLARKDKGDITWIEGPALRTFVQTMASDICWQARACLRVTCNESISYLCSPPALAFAVINAVNNSARASQGADGQFPPDFRIDVSIDQNDAGEMTVVIRDNGPGFPPDLVPKLFSEDAIVSTHGGSGLGLQNMLRYVSHQRGRVRGYNDGGAVVEFTIPQR